MHAIEENSYSLLKLYTEKCVTVPIYIPMFVRPYVLIHKSKFLSDEYSLYAQIKVKQSSINS